MKVAFIMHNDRTNFTENKIYDVIDAVGGMVWCFNDLGNIETLHFYEYTELEQYKRDLIKYRYEQKKLIYGNRLYRILYRR